jgi:hypothetical protein
MVAAREILEVSMSTRVRTHKLCQREPQRSAVRVTLETGGGGADG